MLFDLDGTLMDTTRELAAAVNDTLAGAGLPPVMQAQVDVWVGHGTLALLAQALAYARQTTPQAERSAAGFDALATSFGRHYERHCGTASGWYAYVMDTLLALKGLGVDLGIVTNKEGRYVYALLRAHGGEALFDAVVCGDTLPVRKPDPAGLEHCVRRFGVPHERTLFVGDSSIDVATARHAGVTVWALPGGYNMGEPIEDSRPDRVIADFRVLLPTAAGG